MKGSYDKTSKVKAVTMYNNSSLGIAAVIKSDQHISVFFFLQYIWTKCSSDISYQNNIYKSIDYN